MARDRMAVCQYYVNCGADCQKGVKNVDLAKCKNCPKYRPRKSNKKVESVKSKRQKDKDRHDNWKNY